MLDGQVSFTDYFAKGKLDIKPITLVDFINGMGKAQYTQIGNVVRNTVEQCGNDLDEDAIERITNNVSVWLLKVGDQYKKYLAELM